MQFLYGGHNSVHYVELTDTLRFCSPHYYLPLLLLESTIPPRNPQEKGNILFDSSARPTDNKRISGDKMNGEPAFKFYHN